MRNNRRSGVRNVIGLCTGVVGAEGRICADQGRTGAGWACSGESRTGAGWACSGESRTGAGWAFSGASRTGAGWAFSGVSRTCAGGARSDRGRTCARWSGSGESRTPTMLHMVVVHHAVAPPRGGRADVPFLRLLLLGSREEMGRKRPLWTACNQPIFFPSKLTHADIHCRNCRKEG